MALRLAALSRQRALGARRRLPGATAPRWRSSRFARSHSHRLWMTGPAAFPELPPARRGARCDRGPMRPCGAWRFGDRMTGGFGRVRSAMSPRGRTSGVHVPARVSPSCPPCTAALRERLEQTRRKCRQKIFSHDGVLVRPPRDYHGMSTRRRTTMQVRHIDTIAPVALPGIEHRTLANRAAGIASFEVWQQALAQGTATPLHRHDCEEVIVFTGGHGVMRHAGREVPCGPGTVLLCAPNELHQIVNTGDAALTLYGILSASPVPVMDADGNPIPLPW
ncbi:cupin domain-containing protein [Pseudoduganella flava]|uniref:Cupin domain-containing protein n=2 Tax=Pseudoduganella flava TaxID=871742 RepID=A0ABX6FY52_9BURK|nr:cupin domain-containing protein [Pseudoduganella flava]